MGPRRVLAHREELIFQAADKVQKVTGFRCEVEMADYRADLANTDADGGSVNDLIYKVAGEIVMDID